MITYTDLLKPLRAHVAGDAVWRRTHPQQNFFIGQLLEHFMEGFGSMSHKERIAFINSMCETGESARYGPTAVVENGRVPEPLVRPDYTRVFVTRQASGHGGIDHISQTDVIELPTRENQQVKEILRDTAVRLTVILNS